MRVGLLHGWMAGRAQRSTREMARRLAPGSRTVRCEWQRDCFSQGFLELYARNSALSSRLELLLAARKTLAKNPPDTYSERHRHAVHVHVRRERPPRHRTVEERVDVVRVERRVPRVFWDS